MLSTYFSVTHDCTFLLCFILSLGLLDAADALEGANVDVNSETLTASRLHRHASDVKDISKTTFLGLRWIEVPGKDAIVCPV